jgi:DNA-directed RNA polymerase subunit E'/Rpb7
LESKVSLLPHQLNSEIDDSLLENLKKKVEGKVNKNGIVLRINRIIHYDYGIVDNLTLTGTIHVNVEYECMLCSPTVNSELLCQVENFVKGFILCRNGPIMVAMEIYKIDRSKFNVDSDIITEKNTKKVIEIGSLIKVSIINCNLQLGDSSIYVISKLLNIASKSDEEFYRQEQEQIFGNKEMANDDIFV